MTEQGTYHKGVYRWIVQQTPEGGRVLDIGCGEGDLLSRLVQEKHVRGTGIELDEGCVMQAVQRGLSVHHGDVGEGLDHYADDSFDLVIHSLTLQEMHRPDFVLNEALRVGRQVLVVFPNFGFAAVRWQLGIRGQAPQTHGFPHHWSESPNRHFFTVKDWDLFVASQGWRVAGRHFLTQGHVIGFWPNLRAEIALYLMEK